MHNNKVLNNKMFNDNTPLIAYTARVWRMVEAQETAATLNIVDTMEEQALLEELLEGVKPPYRDGSQGMHYLFKTAFRYPPLKYGSRFGTRLMPSYFYASEKPVAALAETAYYRFVFLQDMQEPYEHEVDSSHTMFSAMVVAERCLDLPSKSFSEIQQKLTDPIDYRYCQGVGDWAVNQRDVQIIRAESARLASHYNVAIAQPECIRSRAPNKLESWLCRTNNQTISFSSREAASLQTFHLSDFCVNGTLPRPA